MEIIITLSFFLIIPLGLIIRSFIKGTFWRSYLSSGLGGAFLGIVLTIAYFVLLSLDSSSFEQFLESFIYGIVALPIAAIIGAVLFILIGIVIRKKAPVVASTSNDLSTPSAGPSRLLFTLIPADSTSQFTILKRPVLVWLFTLYFSYGFVQTLLLLFSQLEFLNLSSDLYSILNAISFGLIVPQTIFLVLFFNLRKSSLKWYFLSFLPAIVITMFYGLWLWVVVMALISWVIWDYISHKTVNSEPVFN